MQKANINFILLIAFLAFGLSYSARAQSVDDATMQVSEAYKTFKRFSEGVSAICAIIGGSKVYAKFSSGDPDLKRGVLVWFGAALFAILIPRVLDALFR